MALELSTLRDPESGITKPDAEINVDDSNAAAFEKPRIPGTPPKGGLF